MEEPQPLPTSADDLSANTAKMLRTLRDQAEGVLGSHRRRIEDIEADLNRRIEQVSEELARDQVAEDMEVAASQQQREELERRRTELEQAQSETATLREQLAEQTQQNEQLVTEHQEDLDECNRLAKEVGQLRASVEQHEQESNSLREQCNQLGSEKEEAQNELHSARQALDELRAQECEGCTQLRDSLSETSRDKEASELQAQQLDDELHALTEELQQARLSLKEAESARHQSAASLGDAEHRIEELQSALESSDELDTLKSQYETQISELTEQKKQAADKCDLALADVHNLKRENARLQEELDARPAADHESAELISLRAERDALASRITELESAPAAPVDEDREQELSDLQRRFEMAVDDVRQLKQENSELREQCNSSSSQPAETSDSGAMDWQAQKARLLAALDAEDGGTPTPERRVEQTTIEGTISITDRVVSEKDREIAELREQLEAGANQPNLEAQQQAARDELFDKDEIIQAEREKIEKVHQEWKEKLRTAELEISVQRATLAREQAALEEKLANMPEESETEEIPAEPDGKPKRRWLSALGLRDDDDE